jgi:GNAT superfamily N-acetyltransferase
MLEIRRASEADFGAMWLVFQAVVAPGDTYVFSPTVSRRDVYAYWFDREITAYVAEDSGHLVGMYKLLPNQPGLGSHVANASFMVSPAAHRKGIGRAIGQHCLKEARRAGYLAMQFNVVVSTNEAAVKLWKSWASSLWAHFLEHSTTESLVTLTLTSCIASSMTSKPNIPRQPTAGQIPLLSHASVPGGG